MTPSLNLLGFSVLPICSTAGNTTRRAFGICCRISAITWQSGRSRSPATISIGALISWMR
jgi:hypothetical protein